MEVLVLGFPTKDLRENPCSNQDSQKESSKHKGVYEGQYALQKGVGRPRDGNCPEATEVSYVSGVLGRGQGRL